MKKGSMPKECWSTNHEVNQMEQIKFGWNTEKWALHKGTSTPFLVLLYERDILRN